MYSGLSGNKPDEEVKRPPIPLKKLNFYRISFYKYLYNGHYHTLRIIEASENIENVHAHEGK
jgi:hypothetical protein